MPHSYISNICYTKATSNVDKFINLYNKYVINKFKYLKVIV